jgi:tetratricopeptide (TPR) repeat protein
MLLGAAMASGALGGTLEPRVWCEGSPAHSYALYLPSGWTPERRWPVLLVLDPRGRALAALERFQQAADRSGFVVASSWDSASDVLGPDPTPAAVTAILLDLPPRAHIAADQVVLAGFSGTARTAWAIGEVAPEIVFGVIAAGGATADGLPPSQIPPFVWAGAAGTTDFNFGEMRLTEQWLREQGAQARLEVFEGTHQWPSSEVLGRSLAWVVLAGAQRGRLPAGELPAELPSELLAHAASLGPTWEGWLSASSLRPLGLQVEAAPGPQARRRALEEDQLGRAEAQALARLDQVVAWLRDSDRAPPGVLRARTLLQARALERAATSRAGTPRGRSAARSLARFDAELSFYIPRDLRAREDHEGVLASMKIAAAVGPAEGSELYDLACAHARLGQHEPALEALSRAIEAGFRDRWHAERDPDLQSLRSEPQMQALLAQIELDPRSADSVLGFLGVSPGLEVRRGDLASGVAQAFVLVDEFVRQHGGRVPTLRSVEIYRPEERPRQPLPAVLEQGVLLAPVPEASGPEPWPHLLARALVDDASRPALEDWLLASSP